MSRPRADAWSVIGEAADPVPGDPDEVARLGRSLRRTAEAIRKQAEEIKALSSVASWKGKAADEFREQAGEAEGKLRKAFQRYDTAADALGEKSGDGTSPSAQYAPELHRAQRMADKALRDAQDADDDRRASDGALDKLPEDTAADAPDRSKLEKRQEAAATALERAKKDLEAAKDVRDTAAKRARDAIRHAIDHDGLKDGRWDKLKDWVHDNSGWIKDILDAAGWVATICGTLSLFVGWIPVIGQALAGLLGSIALLATAVSLIGHVLLALSGDGSWFDVALDVVGLATFGVGRGAIAGARAASQGAMTLGRTAAARALRAGITAKPGTAAYFRATNKAWRDVNRLIPGSLRGKAGVRAIDDMPPGWSPGAGRLAEAFSPKLIFGEWKDGLKGARELSPSNLRQMLRADTWRGGQWRAGDMGLAELETNLARMPGNVRAVPEVSDAIDVFKAQTRLWQGSTALAVTTDALDKGPLTGVPGELMGVDMSDGLWDALGLKNATTTSDG
ncbi:MULTISPECIES: putative T7SS-secreted protein [unclassified Streptomyces]|uniref:putative T7SS-secreted protein n=1 Tax=unclassified Streptomyces TaxID=2593676 RepID=UPI0038105D39